VAGTTRGEDQGVGIRCEVTRHSEGHPRDHKKAAEEDLARARGVGPVAQGEAGTTIPRLLRLAPARVSAQKVESAEPSGGFFTYLRCASTVKLQSCSEDGCQRERPAAATKEGHNCPSHGDGGDEEGSEESPLLKKGDSGGGWSG
jgi:hypothetical protein